ncbi:MAG: nucleoside hydrolase, partial [Alphaproteobacteria bacterium]
MVLKKLLIDTDGGVDDALAILAALGAAEAEVVALTTVAGNVGLDQATANAGLIRRMFSPACAVPVSRGLPAAHKTPRATAIHGEDGLGGISGLRDEAGAPRYVWPVLSPAPLSAAEKIRAQCGVYGAGLT